MNIINYTFSNNDINLFEKQKYICIDNFLDTNFALKCQNELLNINVSNWDRYNNIFEQKYTFRDKYNFPDSFKILFKYLTSNSFIKELNILTGLNLINDPYRLFWGIHKFENNDKLDIHLDAGKHLQTHQIKAITLGIYLSYDWKEENKGHLEIWDGDDISINEKPIIYNCIEKILPKFNRLIIFECNNKLWHGAPESCICLNNEKRFFITLSYLINLTNSDYFQNIRYKAYFIKRPQDPEDEEKDKLRILRSNPNTCENVYFIK